MAHGDQGRAEPTGSGLEWLSAILWPDDQTRLVAGGGRGDVSGGGHGEVRVGLRWWAAPAPASAETLIPATSPAAARTAVRRYHNGFTLRRRSRSWAAELGMAVPRLAGRLLNRRLVSVEGRAADGLLCHLAELLAAGRSDLTQLHVAVTLGRPKSNRKPVLQLIDQSGVCLGWAKIGWNDWTNRLVANEARWLRARPRPPLATPGLIGELTVDGQQVVIAGATVAGRLPRWNRGLDPRLVDAVADLGTRDRVRFTESPWWASVQEVRAVATPSEDRAIDQVAGTAEGLLFDIGAWHGDLTPWNIMTAGPFGRGSAGRLHHVIDWEFAADGVPVGFDVCHHHTQVGTELKGMSPDDALDYGARLSPQGLAALGVDPHNQIAVYRLYLVELIRRTLALRSAGVPVNDVKQGAAAVRRIRADVLAPPLARLNVNA